ncbi:hypothetical protein VTK73DRAFT_4423 [Phialemonium thermophilum]|uniref:MARVEL domain-containing protein n=1 Tax=Phialemonium thermophilum TaxID=223376 RepID=A0ABR3WU41_9PEZI
MTTWNMGRDRLPRKFAFLNLFTRSAALAVSFASLCVAINASVRYDHAKEMIGVYVAGCWAILLDSTEIAALCDSEHRVKRLPSGCLALLEFLTSILCAIVPFLVWLGYVRFDYECDGTPAECQVAQDHRTRADNEAFLAFALQWTVGGLHFLFACFACVTVCRGR